MILSEDIMLAVIDGLSAGLSYSGAALGAGVKPRTLWYWIKQSQSGLEQYTLDFLGSRVPFHVAVNTARKILHHEARSRFEKRATLGHDEPVTFQGRQMYRENLLTVGWTEDEREALGFERDGLLRNERGEVIPLTVHTEPPVAATLALLSMAFAQEYTPKQRIETGPIATGVIQPKPMSGPPTIPPAPVMPELEILPVPGTEGAMGPELSLEEILGDEPEVELPDEPDDNVEPNPRGVLVADAAAIAAQPKFIPPGFRSEWEKLVAKGAIKPDVVIAVPTPSEYQPTPAPILAPRSKLSAAELSLLSRLPASTNRGSSK
jgi:hypothetical protein